MIAMDEMRPPDRKAEAWKLVNRLLEYYIGERRTGELSAGWRILSAFSGTVIFISLSIVGDNVNPEMFKLTFQSLHQAVHSTFVLLVILSPLVLALVIAYSMKGGGPLRLFLTGFFLYYMILTVTR